MGKEKLYRLFDGVATEAEEQEILDWLDADPANRQEMLALRRVYDASLLLTKPARRFVLPHWTHEVIRYAAVVAVVAGLGALYVSQAYKALPLNANTIRVPAGQRVDLVLSDGTRVCMNALSELTYPAAFAEGERKVQLKGEAFFDVKHDAKHPFVVETYACDVKVLGTKFDVEARAETNEFVAALVEGRVEVRDRSQNGRSVILTPNEQVQRMGGRLVVSPIPVAEEFQWREGLIAFRDASFRELLSDFEQYYGVKFELRRASLPQNLFTGKIRISEGIDHALWVLQRSADFKYERNDDNNIIYIY